MSFSLYLSLFFFLYAPRRFFTSRSASAKFQISNFEIIKLSRACCLSLHFRSSTSFNLQYWIVIQKIIRNILDIDTTTCALLEPSKEFGEGTQLLTHPRYSQADSTYGGRRARRRMFPTCHVKVLNSSCNFGKGKGGRLSAHRCGRLSRNKETAWQTRQLVNSICLESRRDHVRHATCINLLQTAALLFLLWVRAGLWQGRLWYQFRTACTI